MVKVNNITVNIGYVLLYVQCDAVNGHKKAFTGG